MARLGLVAAAVLAAAAGGWLLLQEREGRETETGTITSMADAGRPDPAGAPAGAGPAAVPALTPLEARAFDHLVDEVAAPEAARGGGTISGTVLTPDGRPFAGALVRATSTGEGPRDPGGWQVGDGPPPEPDLVEKVRSYVARQKREEALRLEARSDAKGEYTLAGVTDDPYRIEAWAQGHRLDPENGRAWNIRAGERVDFTAVPIVAVRVTVVGAEGEARVMLNAREGFNTRMENWFPARPELRLSPGTYALWATAGRDDVLRSDEQTVTVEVGNPPPEVTLELRMRPTIKGRVRLPRHHPKDRHLEARCLRWTGDAEPPPTALVANGQRTTVHPWSGYEFSFSDLAPGRHLLGVTDQDRVLATATAEVGPGVTTVELVVPEPDAADLLVVWVLEPGGKPLAGARISAHDNASRRWFRGPPDKGPPRRQDGAYEVSKSLLGVTASGKDGFSLIVEHDAYGVTSLRVENAATSEVTVRFDLPAEVQVSLSGYAGHPSASLMRLELQPKREAAKAPFIPQPPMGGDKRIGEDGTITFTGIQPGDYVLNLKIATGEWQQEVIASQEVAVRPGANAVSMRVPPLYELIVRLPEGQPEGRIQLQAQAGSQMAIARSSQIRAEQPAVFANLPPGPYRLQIWGGGRPGMMSVTVPDDREVLFAPEVQNALRVGPIPPGSDAERLGLREGDVIVGVDGTRFDDTTNAPNLFWAIASAKKSLTATVLRGTETQEITIATEDLNRLGRALLQPFRR